MTGASPAEPALIAADDCPRPPQPAAEHRLASVSPYAAERSNSEQLMRRDFDPRVPNVARIYNWLLGGKDNFAADRRAAAKLLDAVPHAAVAARENRAFLHRAVRFLANEAGIRQFVDIGAGLPTARAVHEIIHGLVPPPVVVYADNDPVVIRHAEALVGGAPGAAAIQADLRQPRTLLDLAAKHNLIDLARPLAILLVSHVTADHIPLGAARQAQEAYADASAPGVPSSRAQVLEFFGGLDMVRPGLVNVSAWRPAGG